MCTCLAGATFAVSRRRYRKHVLTLICLFYATYTTKFAGNSQVSHAAIFIANTC
jgi:hypothetical protein